MHIFRLHGRGGQGVDSARRILGRAAFLSGFHVQDFTLHPMEWRTQPTVAYVKASKAPIISRDATEPDYVLVLEPKLNTTTEIKEDSIIIYNSEKPVKSRKGKGFHVPATEIALTHRVQPNTAMLGALCKIFPKLSMRSIKNAVEIELKDMQAENSAAIEEGFRSVKRGMK